MKQLATAPETSKREVHHFTVAAVAATDLTLPLSRRCAVELGLRGLHCGSGANLKEACLNTDEAVIEDRTGRRSYSGAVALVDDQHFYLQHDATDTFPVEDECFEWVYTEHFIEHVPLPEGIEFLKEMHRILRPGGFIRVSTPDLARYAAGYCEPGEGFLAEHARRLEQMGLRNLPRRRAWLVNQIFYNWGHRWIYDFEELRLAAAAAGFDPRKVKRCRFREGRLSAVAALDLAIRNDESLYVEIAKDG